MGPDFVRLLVERAQAGDNEAFGEIYERYVAPVYTFIGRRVRGDRHLVEDLTADTFVRALRGLHRYQWTGRDLGAWLVTIARNLIADHYKGVRRRLVTLTDDLDGVTETEDSPELAAVDQALRVQLLAAIGQLKETQRAVVMLRFYLGLSLPDTAASLGITPGAVRSQQYRALRSLEQLLPASVLDWR